MVKPSNLENSKILKIIMGWNLNNEMWRRKFIEDNYVHEAVTF